MAAVEGDGRGGGGEEGGVGGRRHFCGFRGERRVLGSGEVEEEEECGGDGKRGGCGAHSGC